MENKLQQGLDSLRSLTLVHENLRKKRLELREKIRLVDNHYHFRGEGGAPGGPDPDYTEIDEEFELLHKEFYALSYSIECTKISVERE